MIVLNRKTMGFTLIEAAVIIMLLSIALIPIVKMAANTAGDSSGSGIMTGATSGKLLSREKTVANTIMEKAIAGDYSDIVSPVVVSSGTDAGSILSFNYDPATTNFKLGYLNTDGSFNYGATFTPPVGEDATASTTGLSNQKYTFPKYQYASSGIYYKWSIEDATLQQYTPTSGVYAGTSIYSSFMPKGNNLIKAILRVYTGDDAATSTTPSYVLSTYFYKNTAENTGGGDQFTDTIGISLALDVSLSMRMSNFVGEGIYDYVPSTAVSPPYLVHTDTFATSTKMPMRLSSGLAAYDPYSIASPYLVYRSGVKDLFFSKAADDPLTSAYDERYDPCYAAQATPLDMASYPATASDPLSSDAGAFAQVQTNCAAVPPVLPTGANAEAILVKVPTRPPAAMQTSITTGVSASTPAYTAQVSNWGGAGVSTEQWIYGDNCLDHTNPQNSTCPISTDSFLLNYPAGAGFNAPVAVLDTQSTERIVAGLFGYPGSAELTKSSLSRIEAARTAMLAFVLTIESNTSLVDNFRLGLVPFSTVVNDGTSYGGITFP